MDKIIVRTQADLDAIPQDFSGVIEIPGGTVNYPAADVAPVRHARWCTTDAFPHRVYCSVCHKTYIPNYHWQVWQDEYDDGGLPRDYCPNCGAKMDLGADE